jgi:hypothetical protein
MPERRQAARKFPAVYSAHRHSHRRRLVGRRSVVVLRQGEP